MIIIAVLAIVLTIGIVIAKHQSDYVSMPDLWVILMNIISGVFLFMALLALPIERMNTQSEIERYKSVQKTVENARNKGLDVENTAISIKIAQINEWLASVQYYNKTMLDIWIPDEVEELEPIE